MCILTPLGVNFKSGVVGKNTMKSQSHRSYNVYNLLHPAWRSVQKQPRGADLSQCHSLRSL